MRVLDLFSGIGGFSLGLERAGMTTVAFCEVDPFCRAVLRKHWPEVPVYDDVQTLNATRLASDGIAVDVICGGFPCQDISTAGKGAGLAGARSGLWFEFHRLIAELRPRYAIIENVAALRSKGLDEVLSSLAKIGYDAEWHCIPASYVGAPHQRDRIWVVANADHKSKPISIVNAKAPWMQKSSRFGWERWENNARTLRMANGIPARIHRLKALGNAVVPQIPEIIARGIMSYEQSRNYINRHQLRQPSGDEALG